MSDDMKVRLTADEIEQAEKTIETLLKIALSQDDYIETLERLNKHLMKILGDAGILQEGTDSVQ